jgi:hypothetical protein
VAAGGEPSDPQEPQMPRHLSVPPLGLDAIANTDGPEYAKIIIPRSCIGTPSTKQFYPWVNR